MRQEARVASQFNGRLDEFSLLPGDKVKRGQRIGTIIPAEREILLTVLQDMPVDTRGSLEQQIRSIALYAPIDGTVLDVWRHTGDVVDRGEEIVHVGDLTVLDIWGQLPLRYLPFAKKAKKIEIRFPEYSHPKFSLPVEAFTGKIDEATQSMAIRLRLDNAEGEFRPGTVVELSFPGPSRVNALTVPREALLQEEGFFHVFVLKGNHVERRPVEVGLSDEDHIEIIAGAEENEYVIVDKAYSLQDGMEVSVK
jgi:RND family efflux transporter MFP subunit